MENQKMPEYETIRAAVAGEKWAVEKFHCFSCASAEFHKVLRSANSGGTWGGSMISLWVTSFL